MKALVDHNISTVAEFDLVTAKLSELLKAIEAPVKSDPGRVREDFLSSDYERQQSFINKVKWYSDLIVDAAVEDIGLWRDRKFLWKSFKRLLITPPIDLLETIETGDHIELYDSNGVQLFSNFEFCSVISYTFEEIIWYPWSELFGRDIKYTEAITNEFMHCLQSATGPFKPDIPPHKCWEIMSNEKRTATVSMKMFSPIFGQDGQSKVLLATSNIQLLN